MAERKHLPERVQTEVLTKCLRRCCLCYYLEADDASHEGQIAHLDKDSGNDDIDNLVWLCLKHHDQFDSRTSQSKGLTQEEVKSYRKMLHGAMEQRVSTLNDQTALGPATEVLGRCEKIVQTIESDRDELQSAKVKLEQQLQRVEAALVVSEADAANAKERLANIGEDVRREPHVEGHVLLLEPDQILRERLSRILGMYHFRVIAVATAENAITEMREKAFDIFVGELYSPTSTPELKFIDGCEIRLMKEARSRGIPCIAFTVLHVEVDPEAVELVRLGYTVLTKPISVAQMLKVVQRLMRSKPE